jgi:protein involved in polysaccharide export with SLBB domain
LNENKTIQILKFSIDDILQNNTSANNYILKSEDKITVYTQERYTRKDFISVSGAIRSPQRIPFDANRNIRISDFITIAGGTLPNATSFAYLMRRDTSNSIPINYQTIDLISILKNPNSTENIFLRPNDSLHIFTKESYMDNAYVRITGSVRSPGEYKFDKSLSLKDILTLASGLKLEAATNRVDIFRVVLDSVNPVRTVAATIAVDRDMNILDERYKTFQLEPYDQIVVRALPEFSFQKMITISGEVKYPGPYAILEKNEKLTSIIQRAGGLTLEAFMEGSTLYRTQDNVGFVILDMDDAVKNPTTSKHNFILKEGDLIEIPKIKDFVTIQGATKANEIYTSEILNNGKINVAYNEGKRAWFYVDKYAAGTNKDGRRYLITVTQPNGKIERTKRFLFLNFYPKVQKGSIVNVGIKAKKEPKPEKEKKEKSSDFDFKKAIAESFTFVTSVLTLVLLIQQLKKQ